MKLASLISNCLWFWLGSDEQLDAESSEPPHCGSESCK